MSYNVDFSEVITISEFLNDELIYTRNGVVSFHVPTSLIGLKIVNVTAGVYQSAVTPVDITVRNRVVGSGGTITGTICTMTLPASTAFVEKSITPFVLVANSLITVDTNVIAGTAPKGLIVTLQVSL